MSFQMSVVETAKAQRLFAAALFIEFYTTDNTLLDNRLRVICKSVLEVPALHCAPASTSKHHCYPGGLLVHTAEVMKNAMALAKSEAAGDVRRDVLAMAALFHDFCKIHEYQETVLGYRHTPYRSLIYHISGSYAKFESLCDSAGFYDYEMREAIGHCILAHHGRPEWGSPVEPQTKEALILHSADM